MSPQSHSPRNGNWRLRAALLGFAALSASSALRADQVTYTYDALGRLELVTYPSGTSVQYNYDAAGNRTQVTNNGGAAPMAVSVQVAPVSGSTSLSISWSVTDNSGYQVGDYDVYRGSSLIASGLTTTSYTDKNCGSGLTCTYQVVAHDADGNSGIGSGSGKAN